MSATHLLAIDQGTTSSRAIVFDAGGTPKGSHQIEIAQHYPADGWVEHDANEIFETTKTCIREAVKAAKLQASDIRAAGITNQRETIILWDRKTGEPLYHAIVWQDRRTAGLCERLKNEGKESAVQAKTGLLLDPYFSGTKLAWLLDNIEGARARAAKGELAAGTVDCWLLWKLTGGAVHATDATNASRTLLFNIHEQKWDDEILSWLNIPRDLLPEVKDCDAEFGVMNPDILGAEVLLCGIAGDQHAATVGQTCFKEGMLKSTYGTGCFALLNTGSKCATSKNKLLSTVAYRLKGQTTYAVEGSIFVAGSAVKWLRDKAGLIKDAAETEALARGASDKDQVYLVPAFTGLGAPYWDPHARGAMLGMTLDTGRAELVRATLDAVCYQTQDLMRAMAADVGNAPTALRVDGGMVANDWLLQRLADLTGLRVERPKVTETTALGAAYLAGLGSGLYQSTDDIAHHWALDASFEPQMSDDDRERRYAGWLDAVTKVQGGA